MFYIVGTITHPRCILSHGKITNGICSCKNYECGNQSEWGNLCGGPGFKACCDCGQDRCWNGKKCVER